MAEILDGKALSKKVKAQVKTGVEELLAKGKETHLAVVLVGDDPASAIYVKHKHKDCKECGIISHDFRLSNDTSQEELLGLIDKLNADTSIDGILVQLPLSKGLDEHQVIERIHADKDVDAFHPFNIGLLSIGMPRFAPCTPAGVMEFFEEYKIDIASKNAVVIGRSNIVGKPMAQLLSTKDATVTLCHSHTQNLAEICRGADIVVCAVGKPKIFGKDYFKEGAVVIDVGMNRDSEGKLCGDVDFEEVEPIASYITPVPGGVGPMTRAELMKNTFRASELHI